MASINAEILSGKEEALNLTTTKPHNSTSRGAKNEMSHGKPNLANHIMTFICTTFSFAVLGFGYFAGSMQTAVNAITQPQKEECG